MVTVAACGSDGEKGALSGAGGVGATAPSGEAGDEQGEGGAEQGGAGQGEGGAGQGEGGSNSAMGGAETTGDVPPELVGIWQQTRATAGNYTNGYGDNFSITSGFSVQLRIRATGEYYFAHSASGVSNTCGQVTYLDHHTGAAILDGTTLTLQPTERRLEVDDCANTRKEDLSTEPIVLSIGLEESSFSYGGLRTYLMNVEGGPHPWQLTLLHRPPLAEPPQPEQPADFVLGTPGPFAELQGLWVPAPGTDVDFFDPATGKFYFPELNGSLHQWLRFVDDSYEAAVAIQNINEEGACESDAIYYEQGKAVFAVNEDVGNQGSHFLGHARLEATAARLIVNVRDCEPDNEVFTYDLPPQVSYYRWIYFTAARPPETLSMGCDAFARSEWQTMLCTINLNSFFRRE